MPDGRTDEGHVYIYIYIYIYIYKEDFAQPYNKCGARSGLPQLSIKYSSISSNLSKLKQNPEVGSTLQ